MPSYSGLNQLFLFVYVCFGVTVRPHMVYPTLFIVCVCPQFLIGMLPTENLRKLRFITIETKVDYLQLFHLQLPPGKL